MRHPGSLILAGLIALLAASAPAHAAFHDWNIREIYSNADGTIQYIELVSPTNGQTQLATHTLTATSSTGTVTFTFPTNLSGTTTNMSLLIATPGFARLPGAVTPDYTLPCGPFFTPGTGNITIDFSGFDAVTFPASMLPSNGTDAIHDNTPGGTPTLVVGANTPENFAGTDGTGLNCPSGACNACDDGLFCTGTESCTGNACASAGACTDICDEGADTCVECNGPSDCDDSNICTTDTCTLNVCANTNNTLTCTDGLFCTLTDVCGGGTCGGSGDACAGQNCNEGTNACGDCLVAGDCADGAFCNGEETCSLAGACENAAAGPCMPDVEACDEVGDVCAVICGNGVLDGTEVCDDGNVEADDGCGEGCEPEDGWTCDGAEPTVCTEDPAPPDAAVADPDAGPTDPPPADDGCCSTGAPRTGSALLSLLVLGLALRRRRRP